MDEKLIAMGWVCTDPSCNQYRFDIDSEGYEYLFREDRQVAGTNKIEVFESEINLNDYTWLEKVEACESFGYTAQQVDNWLAQGEELALIAECLFELEL